METVAMSLVSKSMKQAGEQKKLSGEDVMLIRHVNLILEFIIINTLQFNKLTSAEEIFERLLTDYTEGQSDMENEIDAECIDEICQELCNNNGVLIKLVKNNMFFYKLNHKNYM